MKTATEVLNDSFKRRKDENISAAGRLMITLEAMEEYASQFQPKWIKIESEEDLPEQHTNCWVIVNGNVFIANSRLKGFYCRSNKCYYNWYKVSHYIPIARPEPPKEE